MKYRLVVIFLFLHQFPLAAPFHSQQSQQESLRQEEEQDYFKTWLDEDVRYIIRDDEKEVFLSLRTDEERESFIEQFWRRRDPLPSQGQRHEPGRIVYRFWDRRMFEPGRKVYVARGCLPGRV